MSADHSWLLAEGRLRTAWRILAYVALLAVVFVAGQFVASILPGPAFRWAATINLAGSSLVAGWIAISHFDGRPLGALGFPLSREALRESWTGTLLGGALIGSAALLLLATGTMHFVPDAGTPAGYAANLLATLLFFAIAAAAEELLLRGYAFQALVEGVGVWPAVLVSSALFSWMHAGNPNIDAIAYLNIFLAGVLLALAYLRTRSLWFATAVHLGWNWVMASVVDLPVSGLTEFGAPLYTARETGADWWTGGEFGLEAGLAGTLVLLAGIGWLLRTRHLRESPAMRALRPLVDRRLGPDEP